ncbi:hypothetical protein SELSPUOL_01757 [Selenomonas sputigena ATCC 35185]|uniref:Uncharacterized protein n=1 Tax=Selenomonas sputigena (strain ATCC 35185 / DSM 20758 / CCUG 44933 / VPI D19B-28) TaxID=546271 RepID=C9LWA3_SELS3|nr:hypothetical protein SELSPUOL_01757 [Selenomonas sputigena ATCC 35185]
MGNICASSSPGCTSCVPGLRFYGDGLCLLGLTSRSFPVQ